MSDERLRQLEESLLFLERQAEQHSEAIEELTGWNRRLAGLLADLERRLDSILNPPEGAVDDEASGELDAPPDRSVD